MSTPAQKANLARIRDNQRRSRARRREYIQELEQRLRAFELQGVEASAEVQMAARRVAEENRQLRELLNKHGFGDEYISQYLQVGTIAPPDPGPAHRFSTGDPGSSVQSLQHLIAPRRPTGMEAPVPFSLPSQVTRELSTTSVSSGSSSAWDPQHSAMQAYGHPQVLPVAAGSVVQPSPHQFTSPVFAEGQIPHRADSFSQVSLPPSANMLEELPQQGNTTQPMVNDNRQSMSYSVPLNPYQTQAPRDFPPQGGYY